MVMHDIVTMIIHSIVTMLLKCYRNIVFYILYYYYYYYFTDEKIQQRNPVVPKSILSHYPSVSSLVSLDLETHSKHELES